MVAEMSGWLSSRCLRGVSWPSVPTALHSIVHYIGNANVLVHI